MGRAIRDALAPGGKREDLLVLMIDGDVGKNMGRLVREELDMPGKLVSIDGVNLQELDFVDVGELIDPPGVVPIAHVTDVMLDTVSTMEKRAAILTLLLLHTSSVKASQLPSHASLVQLSTAHAPSRLRSMRMSTASGGEPSHTNGELAPRVDSSSWLYAVSVA